MKLLKIENNQGFFYVNDNGYLPMDKLTKDALLKLVDITLESEIEIDEYDEKNIQHQAHQVIYKSVSNKLLDLNSRKQEFTDQSERLFLAEYEKYQADLRGE
jgi:hypothetical protein